MLYYFKHEYYPSFIVEAEDNVKAVAKVSAYIKANKKKLDIKVADLMTYEVVVAEDVVCTLDKFKKSMV